MLVVSHLFPCMNAMAVGAQELKVSHLLFPILQASLYGVGVLESGFSGPINVIDFEYPKVSVPAQRAFAAKRNHDLAFLFPLPIFALEMVVVVVPVFLTTGIVAVCKLAWLSAGFAFSLSCPSLSQIAIRRTVFQRTLPMMLTMEDATTFCANSLFSCFHGGTMPHISNVVNPAYVAICEKRVAQGVLPLVPNASGEGREV